MNIPDMTQIINAERDIIAYSISMGTSVHMLSQCGTTCASNRQEVP